VPVEPLPVAKVIDGGGRQAQVEMALLLEEYIALGVFDSVTAVCTS
jgi:hypothetical protein